MEQSFRTSTHLSRKVYTRRENSDITNKTNKQRNIFEILINSTSVLLRDLKNNFNVTKYLFQPLLVVGLLSLRKKSTYTL